MNIYFACSITGGREFEQVYRKIVAALINEGHDIPTSHLAQSESMDKERALEPHDVYERDINWIRACDALVAEVSIPSHGVGYEIGFAINIGKPVLCVAQQERRVSKMITGNPSLKFQAYSDVNDAITGIKEFLGRT